MDVAKRLGGECYSIPKLMKEGQFEFEDKKLGIVFPTYNLGVPKIVEKFLNKANLKSKYIFGIATYGAFSGAVSRHLFKTGKGTEYIKKHTIIMNGMRLISRKLFNNEFDKNFSVDNNCNGCKTCERVCPVDNIKVKNKPIFNNNCQQCMACIHNCPKRAICVKKEKDKTRFINQNITLKEIIDSNI